MSDIEPQITLSQDGPCIYRVEMEYTNDALVAMAQRAAERIGREIDDAVLARLGYVRPVRCRDCERSTIDQTEHEYREPLWCHRFNTDVKPDGYCAWGRRKEDA